MFISITNKESTVASETSSRLKKERNQYMDMIKKDKEIAEGRFSHLRQEASNIQRKYRSAIESCRAKGDAIWKQYTNVKAATRVMRNSMEAEYMEIRQVAKNAEHNILIAEEDLIKVTKEIREIEKLVESRDM